MQGQCYELRSFSQHHSFTSRRRRDRGRVHSLRHACHVRSGGCTRAQAGSAKSAAEPPAALALLLHYGDRPLGLALGDHPLGGRGSLGVVVEAAPEASPQKRLDRIGGE